MQAHVVTAPGDGVAPAVLLSLPASGGATAAAAAAAARQPPAQYLFNVPEGFARLVLEHKLRPGAGLRAAFAPDPAALSGFGGLAMRLRGEGHSQLHVVGPPGTQAAVCSLRHFIHWRHPAVVLEEASHWEAPLLYQDDRIAVAVLWKPPLLAGMWPAPAWLQQAQPPDHSKPVAMAGGGGDDSSSGTEESSSSEESSGSEESSSSEEADSSEESSGSDSSGDEEPQKQPQQAQQPEGIPGKGGMFDALDKLFMSGSGSRRLALDQLKQATAAGAAAGPSAAAAAASGGAAAARPRPAADATARQPAAVTATAAAAAKAAAAVTAPTRQRQPVAAPADAGEADDVAVIGGKRFQRLPAQAGINVWVCQKLASKAAAAGPPPHGPAGQVAGSPQPHQGSGRQLGQQQQGQQQMLGFVCHLRGTDQLLLLTNLHSRAAAAQLQQHPALALLAQQPERVAAVLHLAAPGVAGSRALRQLCQQLRPAVQGPAAGQQLLLEQPGAHGSGQAIGHLASARTTAKLNLVSSRLFPLPAGVPAPEPGRAASSPAAEAEEGAAAAAGQAEGAGDRAGRAEAATGQAKAVGAQDETEGPGRGSTAAILPAVTAAQPSASSSGGVVHVRQLSVLTWRQQEAQQTDTAAADAPAVATGGPVQQPQLRLTVEPAEGFAAATPGGFDAGTVQHEVRQERPQLGAQLQLLREREQHGDLPGPDALDCDGLPAWPCRQNCVAPPPPPPPPLPPPAQPAAPAQLQGWHQPVPRPVPPQVWQQPWSAVAGQQHIKLPQQGGQLLQPPAQQVWQQPPPPQQLGGVMRPLYHQQPPAALHPASLQPQYCQPHQPQVAMQPNPWQLPPGMMLVPAPPPGPPPGPPPPPPARPDQQGAAPPPQQQQEQHQQPERAGPDNKRAAGDLKARLQGAKRQRQESSGPSDAVTSGMSGAGEAGLQQQNGMADAETDRLQQELATPQQPDKPQPWLAGAPPGIQQLAAQQLGGSSASGSSGPEVLFLGTGSAEPSKYRGASAIQLRLSCGQSLLMDCGEGTLGALCRAHGTAAALRHVASLGCLWVSHRHADHMSGVLPLLAAYPASLPPLLVVGPRSLRDWLAEAAAPLGLAGRYLFVHCPELNQPGHWARHALQRHLGVSDMQCVPVRHCSDAYGLVLRHEEGWSLVYSGDTQPCQQLVQAGRGCSLLIHEATFEPCLESQARAKRHSTTAEALDIAQRMGAYRCILTHFSQRYPKWPEGLPLAPGAPTPAPAAGEGTEKGSADVAGAAAMPATAAAASATAAVAFDGMRVPLALLPVLPALMPAVQAALADVEEEEQEEEQQEQEQQDVRLAAPALQSAAASGGGGDS